MKAPRGQEHLGKKFIQRLQSKGLESVLHLRIQVYPVVPS